MHSKKIIFIVAFCIVASGGIFAQQTTSPDTKLPPKYDKWLNEEVPYIISPKEKDVFLKLKTDSERDIFIESFWKQRDPNPATPENEFKDEHYRRLAYVHSKYGTSSMPGWKTEAGRNYIVFGERKFIGWNMKMRILEGIKEGAVEPVKAVTSSYLQYRITASIKTEFDLAEEQKQIRKTFNLKDAKLLTEADFNWKIGDKEREFHIFQLNGTEYLVLIAPVDVSQRLLFRIEVYEQSDKNKINLLDTEFSIPEKNITVFGFEDTHGKPYFLSFRVAGWTAEADFRGSKVLLGVKTKPVQEEPQGAVKATGDIKPPRLIKMVDPVYPETARKAGVEGVVILEATTDIYGRIVNVRVLRSIPDLDQAAIDAVKQWIYEPMLINGKPQGIIFTVTVRFALKDQKTKAEPAKGEEPLRLTGGIEPPKLLKQVDPVYPEDARKSGVEGVVILEATTDISGRVADVKVLRSVPMLDQAAMDAVKQWIYEPVVIDGKPKPVTFTVTVAFRLK